MTTPGIPSPKSGVPINGMMLVESVVKADEGIWGDAKIQFLDEEGQIIDEQAV